MSFYFEVDSVFVANTRSKHKDTNFFVCNVLVNGSLTQVPVFASLGDQGGSKPASYAINQQLQPIDLNPGDRCVFNYLIVNAGTANPVDIINYLITASLAWAGGQGPQPANYTGALQDGDTFFTDILSPILNPHSCDGMVAAEQDILTFDDLNVIGGDQSAQHSVHHPGVRSPAGCGNNSDYTVNWHVFRSIDADTRKKS